MKKPQVIKSVSIVGVVKYMRHDPDEEPKCVCCPGEPAHIFSRSVDFGRFNSAYPEHFGFGANEFIGTHVLYGGYEGKRVSQRTQ
jgi:hypothetical protein